MNRRVILARRALLDLEELFVWLADETGVVTASRYTERLQAFLGRLDIFPERGTLRDDILPGLRLIGFERRVTVGFHVSHQEVVIARILYGGRDLEGQSWNEADESPGG